MVRAIRSISLPKEMDAILENNVDDVSKYFQECIERDFMNQDKINQKIKDHEEAIKELKKLVPNNFKEKESSTEKEKFIRSAKKRIEEHQGEKEFSLSSIWNQYKNLFGEKISLEKFTEMIK